MWKVLIADDEPKIRRGLRATVERIGAGMEVVAEAEDGEMALAAVRNLRPDILLIDVRMPFLNGLDLIERINEHTRDCVIIVITGHDEFDYAKRALQLKVFDLLLKPVSQEGLAAVLQRARDELSALRKQSQYFAWAREQLERNLPLLREGFLRRWVAGELAQTEIDEQLDFLGIAAGEAPGLVVVRVVERTAHSASAERERNLALIVVRNMVEEGFAQFEPICIFRDYYEDIVALTASSGGEAWVDALPRLRAAAGGSGLSSLLIAQTVVPGGLENLPEAYDSLIAELSGQSDLGAIVLKVHEYLENNYVRHGLTLEETAAAMKLSPGYLSRILKQQAGLSFVDYLTRMRVTKATQLMGDPAVKIYEVAELVGFASQHYFSRAFKRVFGIPPVDYRKGG